MNKGIVYALTAAILNASVGIFSNNAFSSGVSSNSVAFYKCLLAFSVLTLYILSNSEQRKLCKSLWPHAHKIALLALFGIFVLYYFETAAYQLSAIGIVIFTLQGVSTITTFMGSQFILKIKHGIIEWFGMFLALIGLIVLFFPENDFTTFSVGMILAAIAGIGYGLFIVLNKKIPLPFKGIPLLWWLLLFGSLFLLVPFYLHEPSLPTFSGWIHITCLGLIGTIGGFYFTIKALSLLKASKVQLCELCEPIFASILGLIFFKEWLTLTDIIGALFIFTSIYMLNREQPAVSSSKKMEKSNEDIISYSK